MSARRAVCLRNAALLLFLTTLTVGLPPAASARQQAAEPTTAGVTMGPEGALVVELARELAAGTGELFCVACSAGEGCCSAAFC